MPCSCTCTGLEEQFGADWARKELAAYRRRGPKGTTRRLLRLIRDAGARADSLLDIGAGIGILDHELLASGTRSAVAVDASAGCIEAACEEAGRRGQADRMQFVHGDAAVIGPSLAEADLVTLDRVVCCYPEVRPLLGAAADKARRYLALSYPRDRWYTRVVAGFGNWLRERGGHPFRTYIHPLAQVDALLRDRGFEPVRTEGRLVWMVSLWARRAAA